MLLSTPSLPTMHQQIGRKQQNILSVPLDIKLSDFLSHGEINHNDTKALSMFVVASLEGCLGTAKKSQDGNYFQICISQLELFLNSLK